MHLEIQDGALVVLMPRDGTTDMEVMHKLGLVLTIKMMYAK